MALPKQSAPVYELVIPSTGKKIGYRPFLVKDEKSLLIANQSKDPDIMIATLKSVIESCVVNPIDVDTLSLFDMEYLFCKLRAKSVGELVDIVLKCSNCGEKTQAQLDISNIEVEIDPEHSKKFILFDNVGICMKYPNYELLQKIKNYEESEINTIDSVISIMINCIDYIYDDKQIYYAHETDYDELNEFINNLTKSQLEKITHFFDSMPKMTKSMEFDCHKCGHHNKAVLEGIQNFF